MRTAPTIEEAKKFIGLPVRVRYRGGHRRGTTPAVLVSVSSDGRYAVVKPQGHGGKEETCKMRDLHLWMSRAPEHLRGGLGELPPINERVLALSVIEGGTTTLSSAVREAEALNARVVQPPVLKATKIAPPSAWPAASVLDAPVSAAKSGLDALRRLTGDLRRTWGVA